MGRKWRDAGRIFQNISAEASEKQPITATASRHEKRSVSTLLPASRHFRPITLRPRNLLINFRLHWRDPGLPWLFAEGFLLMGAFVTLFNYIGYRLLDAPAHPVNGSQYS